MSGTERRYQKRIDEMILSASADELERLQRIDLEMQKSGGTFYESYAQSSEHNEKLDAKKTRQI